MPATAADDLLRQILFNFLKNKYEEAQRTAASTVPPPRIPLRTAASVDVDMTGDSDTPPRCPPVLRDPAVPALQRTLAALVDHVTSNSTDAAIPGLEPSAESDTIPDYVKNAFKEKPYELVVPDDIPEAKLAEDKLWLEKLERLRSIKNSHGERNPEDLQKHMQTRFCPPGMKVVNIDKTGNADQRVRQAKESMLQLADYERYLTVRLQRNEAQNRSLGDAISKQAIEDLKQREFRLYGQIRTRYRLMLMPQSALKSTLTGMTDVQDRHYIQSTFKVSAAKAKTMLSEMQKAEFAAAKRKVSAGAGADDGRKKRKRRERRTACYHCGAFGRRYHTYPNCEKWKRGDKPSNGSKFWKDLQKGKTIPTPAK